MGALPAILHDQISALLDAGDRLFERGDDEGALKKYREAETLLPSNRQPWEASTLVLIAIGDTLFQMRDFAAAAQVLLDAIDCASGEENPFVHLRLGQCAYELGEHQGALESLRTAYKLGGPGVFEDEEDVYLALLREMQA